ncbi:ribosome biogenesis GTPase YlqF [Desulfitobacterium metallireducens]|uniref:Ribosome biogenesis GTPase A n=1 Tax=Desulfitobacterium metallireducens DSM 15288 TaxID=871968 RepID=W0EER2_9FIRM|nr:ribosome biogenesis GTPase YlqF [Desulfitobacterium metallireducens]AHF07571.1 GTPase YlqF [Desulfitobacterium metallireducens DSM 15288]
MSIQWFPGHMAKAKRLLLDQLKWVDVVVELGDARVPESSRNPLLQQLIKDKPKIVLLNKADLADPQWTDIWLNELKKTSPVLAVSATAGFGVGKIVPELERLMAGKQERMAAKGVRARSIRAMVIGIPNIGKSSLINQLTGSAKAKTGNKPGVTRGNQWIRIHDKVELMDTPGLLWPKFEDPEVGNKLAATGTIRDEVLNQEELSEWLLMQLKAYYPTSLERYTQEPAQLTLEGIGRSRGCLIKGGQVDILKASQIFLREFRAGALGKMTLDRI